MSLHPMITYWSHVFSRYAEEIPEGLAFNYLNYTDPLMSPRFITGDQKKFIKLNVKQPYFNFIGDEEDIALQARKNGYEISKKFMLGQTNIKGLPGGCLLGVEKISLQQALLRQDFLHLLKDGFGNDADFLKMMLRDLVNTNAAYHTLFLRQENKLVGMVSVGVNGSIGLVLNAVIDTEFRGQRLSHQLVLAVTDFFSAQKVSTAFFWTVHDGLKQHGQKVQHYMVFTRSDRLGL